MTAAFWGNLASSVPDGRSCPSQADAVLMKHILHDWSDDDSVKILRSLHTAMPAHGKLILAEAVIPDPGQESPVGTEAKLADILMFLIGGKVGDAVWHAIGRTSREYAHCMALYWQ